MEAAETDRRITTPFRAGSTAAEVVAGLDLSGKRAIVTGGASGIGIEAARALVGAGAAVTLAVRNIRQGHRRSASESGVGAVARYALDPGNAKRLWEVSLELTA